MKMEDAVYYREESVGRPGFRRAHFNPEPDDDDEDDNACRRCCKKCCSCFKSCLLTLLIFISVCAGIGLGAFLRFVPPFDKPRDASRELMYLLFPATLLMRLMQFLLIPLIISSLISGLGALNGSLSAKIGLRALAYYICTTILAVGQGLGFVYAIRPGMRDVSLQDRVRPIPPPVNWIDTFLDVIRNIVPDNFITAGFQLYQTRTEKIYTESGNNSILLDETVSLVPYSGVNLLGLSFCAILFGVGFSRIGDRGRWAGVFFDAIFDASLIIAKGLVWTYPVSLLLILTHTVVSLEQPMEQMESLFLFLLTVLLSLFTHACLILPVVYVIFTRRNPFRLMYNCFRAILVAFASNNISMTLPVTMDCLQRAGIHHRVVRVMCPIGAFINLDGLALYEAMAGVFMATLRGIDLSWQQILILMFTPMALSLVAPCLGSGREFGGGGSTLFIILFQAVGLDPQDVFLLLTFDWMMVRFRTTVSVWTDCVGVGVVDKCSRLEMTKVAGTNDGDDKSSVDLGHPDGAVLTGYMPRHPRDWTVRLINERGDKMCVSKV